LVVSKVSVVIGVGLTSVDLVAVAVFLPNIAVSVATTVSFSACYLTTIRTTSIATACIGKRNDTTIAATTSVVAIAELFAIAVVPSAVVTSAIVWFALVA
jgi:hypothetical protein